MKKFSVLSIAALTLFANTAQAAFLAPGTNGRIELLSGCFAFGDCSTGLPINIVDNGITSGGLGGIAGDGVAGFIDFTMTDGNNFAITNYSQDTYQGTPVGNKSIGVTSTASMSGFFSDTGDVTIDPTGRISHWQFFDVFGIQNWNVDDSIATQGFPQTGLYDQFTSGTDFALDPFTGEQIFTLTGEALTSVGPGEWTGTIVMAGNTGKDWGVFDGTPYSEVFSIRVVTTVPVPAAIWLIRLRPYWIDWNGETQESGLTEKNSINRNGGFGRRFSLCCMSEFGRTQTLVTR